MVSGMLLFQAIRERRKNWKKCGCNGEIQRKRNSKAYQILKWRMLINSGEIKESGGDLLHYGPMVFYLALHSDYSIWLVGLTLWPSRSKVATGAVWPICPRSAAIGWQFDQSSWSYRQSKLPLIASHSRSNYLHYDEYDDEYDDG